MASAKAPDFTQLGISEASLDALQPLIPSAVDLNRNIDLLGVAFNAAVVNRFNRNDDGIDTDSAVEIADYFINKPTNIEHRKQIVVGHIVSSAFSKFGSNELLSIEEVEESREPFNIALAAVVYKTVNPQFANLIEDEDEEYDNVVSASWELGFNDYCLALGSKNLNEAEIITDRRQIEELSPYLKAFDGPGKTDEGISVNRLIIGEIFPLGIAFTTHPAADVEGLYVEAASEPAAKRGVGRDGAAVVLDSGPDFKNKNEKSSHSGKTNVNSNNDYTYQKLVMNSDILEKFEEILAQKLDNKQFSEEAVASVTQVFQEAIRQKNEEYKAAKEEQEAASAEATAQNKQLEKDVESLKEQLSVAETELTSLKEERTAQEAQECFNTRMAGLDNEFELQDTDREILATELRDLDVDEEAFASYLEKVRLMWGHKAKTFIQASEKQIQERIDTEVAQALADLESSTASTETTEPPEAPEVEEVLDELEEQPAQVATNNNAEASQSEPSLRERFKDAFSIENLTINI